MQKAQKKLSPQAEAQIEQLYSDFPLFASECLWIRTKLQGLIPFNLNFSQRYLHNRVEEQLKEKGWVRVILLKARQWGASTYICGRFYRKTSWEQGVRAFILAHRDDATNNLFKMTRRFHDHMPASLRAHTSYSSRQELVFDVMDSSYGLGTAGSGKIGRSDTIQLFHGSEVALWENADALISGVFEAIPDGPGTEIFLESTANGMGNFFHLEWQKAVAGVSDYMPVFVPWFWQPEYSRPVPKDFTLSDEDKEYQEIYKLTLEQMAWRQAKIIKMTTTAGPEGAKLLFKQEYPATANEAFQTTGQDSYISAEVVMRARKAARTTTFGPVVVGVDPATGTAIAKGNDFTGICMRQGPFVWSIDLYDEDSMSITGRCAQLLKVEGEKRVARMFIDDTGGFGQGIIGRLREMGFGDRVTPVHFGAGAWDKVHYGNRRAEMWAKMKEWLEDPVQAVLPDDDQLHADITAPGTRLTSSGQLLIEKKEDIRSRLGRSPDAADALALTFAQPVRNEAIKLQTRAHHEFKMLRKPEVPGAMIQTQATHVFKFDHRRGI